MSIRKRNPPEDEAMQLLYMLLATVAEMVRQDNPDFTLRQLAVFLTCYSGEDAHTVRGLSAHLRVAKPAISRALDRLGAFGLIRREIDPFDRRSVLVQRTLKGAAFSCVLQDIMNKVAAQKLIDR